MELAARYRLVPKAKAKDWWNGEVAKIPPVLNKTVFLLSGALIPVWRLVKNVKDSAFKIVRTTTDEGVRLVGLQIPKTQVKEIVRLFNGVWEQEETASDIYKSVICGKESLELIENIRLKSSKFFGTFYVEIVPGRSEHPKKFRAIGLTSITQNSRERFLLPNNEDDAALLLQKLLVQFPPSSGNANLHKIDQKFEQQSDNFSKKDDCAEDAPIDVREWLIEPDREEFAQIGVRD